MRYYEIARLREGVSFTQEAGAVHINLDKVAADDHILNDETLHEAKTPGVYFYLSGGGSILIEGRYLPVLQRSEQALTNAGKYSLFTGRAEGVEEWKSPRHVMRELFEELHLFQNGRQLIPQCEPYQAIIDSVYQGVAGEKVPFIPVPLSNTRLHVVYDGKEHVYDCFLHIGEEGEINLLGVFAVEHDRTTLEIKDAEAGRPVFLLDIKTRELQEISGKTLGICDKERMTAHLAALVDAL